MRVSNNGVFDFSPQVLSSDRGLGEHERERGPRHSNGAAAALLWLSLHPVDTGLIQAGTMTEVFGSVENRSRTHSIDIEPLEPSSVEGNVGGGALVDSSEAPLQDGVHLPFLGKMKPGQVVELEGYLATAPVSVRTRASLTYKPAGSLVNADGSETALASGQIGMSSGTSPVDIHLSDASPYIASSDHAVGNFFGAAAYEPFVFTANELRAAASVLAHPIKTAEGIGNGIASIVTTTVRDEADAAYLVGAVYFLATGYEALTPDERRQFAEQIVADFEKTHLKADIDRVNEAAENVFLPFQTTLQTGNYDEVARMAGSGIAYTASSVVDAVVTDIAFQKIAIGADYVGGKLKGAATAGVENSVSLTEAIERFEVTTKLGNTLAGIKAGQNLLANSAQALTDVYGLTQYQVKRLQAYCEASGIIVAVRSRSKKAAQLIADGLAVGKNEVIKLKNVNEIDVAYLGYRPKDLNTVVWAEPVDENYVLAQLEKDNADQATRDIVLERYRLRQAEWKDPDIIGTITTAERTKSIDWSFNGKANGAPGANRAATRKFGLGPVKVDAAGGGSFAPAGGVADRQYSQVLVGNSESKTARLVLVTQDVDTMAVLRRTVRSSRRRSTNAPTSSSPTSWASNTVRARLGSRW